MWLERTRNANDTEPPNPMEEDNVETKTPTTDASVSPTKPGARGVYSIPELAELLGVSERHIHRLKDAKEIPGLLKLGGRIVFARVQIDRWLAGAK